MNYWENDPNQDNLSDPLISILIYNYSNEFLQECVGRIFSQEIIQNFEIILIDDATNDGSWEITMELHKKYHKRITVNRNRMMIGPDENLKKCMKMAKGRYFVALTFDQIFLPEYVKSCIGIMQHDPGASFHMMGSVEKELFKIQSMHEQPLVSILCYNYNYGQYLRETLDSIFKQTYKNIELCFSDNASNDESWNIALEFAAKYPQKMYLTRNRKNFGPDDNFANSKRNMRGKYFINFCSDDVMEPEYVERCVNILEKYPDTGMVIVNRTIIDEKGICTYEPSFYNTSCIIPGEEQAAVYMMAGVNPSVSQVMYRTKIADRRASTGGLASRYYGTRILDYNIAMDFDIGYIKESLMRHRIHSKSDTSQADSNLMPIMGLYVLNHQFADIAAVRNVTKVTERLSQSLTKLGSLSVRYCIRSLLAGNDSMALRYYHLAAAVEPQMIVDPVWKQLESYWISDKDTKFRILSEFRSMSNLAARNVSYDPPEGSVSIS
ncbi:MAG: glycosyltransferase family 2 protein [Syntrophothermus sp.]